MKINGVESVSKMLKSRVRKVFVLGIVVHILSIWLTRGGWRQAYLGRRGLDISSYLIIYLSLTSAKGMTSSPTVQTGMAAGAPFSSCEHLGKAAAATQTWVSPWELGQRPEGIMRIVCPSQTECSLIAWGTVYLDKCDWWQNTSNWKKRQITKFYKLTWLLWVTIVLHVCTARVKWAFRHLLKLLRAWEMNEY